MSRLSSPDAAEPPGLPDQASGPLVMLRDVHKTYHMGQSVVHALAGIDLQIARGELVSITGPSGSGKTTLMGIIGCLDKPTSGYYEFASQAVHTMSDRQLAIIRNRSIGFVFQTFNLLGRTTAEENVSVPMFYARKTRVHGQALKALEQVGLADRAHHRPGELSGGERQRVALARAIVNEPILLLADEPTGNLDTKTGAQIMMIVHKLHQQGATVVLVTHEHDIAVQAQRIVQMSDGKIINDRPVDPDQHAKAVARSQALARQADN